MSHSPTNHFTQEMLIAVSRTWSTPRVRDSSWEFISFCAGLRLLSNKSIPLWKIWDWLPSANFGCRRRSVRDGVHILLKKTVCTFRRLLKFWRRLLESLWEWSRIKYTGNLSSKAHLIVSSWRNILYGGTLSETNRITSLISRIIAHSVAGQLLRLSSITLRKKSVLTVKYMWVILFDWCIELLKLLFTLKIR